AGTLQFASGTHLSGYLSREVISEQSHKTLAQYIEGNGMPVVNHGAMAAGDATFHYGWTVHAAPGNATGDMREVMTIIYYADGARLVEPDSAARRNDKAALMPDLQPGDLAAGPLLPLVYP